jgi:hypothetical protein
VETQTTAVCHSATGYRRLVPALASKAARLRSGDPEAAAQEAPLRSLTHPLGDRRLRSRRSRHARRSAGMHLMRDFHSALAIFTTR